MPRRHRRLSVNVFVLSSFIAFASPAFSQAFVPPKGEGDVTISFQSSLARGHLLPTGKLASGAAGTGPVRAQVLTSEMDFGLTDRVALNLSLPFVRARYGGSLPHVIDVHGESTTVDDGTYHSAAQDFRFGLRVNVTTRPLIVTPFADVIVPSHEYETRGHSVPGLNLRGLALGTNVAGFVDAIPGTYFHTQLSHAVVQKVAGIRPNRSRVDSEVGYFVTPRLALRFLESLQITHDGLDFPYAGLSTELSLNHDRLSRNNYMNLGGGFTYAINESLSVFAAASKLVWGQNVHTHRGVTIGLNMHFRMSHETPNDKAMELK
ncbi:MAG: hypothetical protein HY646_00965 [Acidobacteria bacterium]|nr:hypothetical protein [Acidobacteriota bacterium]